MIKRPEDIESTGKRIRMLIAGPPGMGKTTLALSSPAPLLVDCDFGIDRTETRVRAPYIQPAGYQDILTDLSDAAGLQEFQTVVIDTGGKLISLMSRWAIAQNNKYGQSDGSLSLKGYSFVGREFQRLIDDIFYRLQKNVVIVFHSVEQQDGDNIRLRIKCEGGTKNAVWESMDLGGFMEMQGNSRTIGFSCCERYFAKGSRGIQGVYKIPDISGGRQNDFLTRLFEQYNERLRAEAAELAGIREQYAAAMEQGRKIIEAVTDAQSANASMERFAAIQHAMTSRRELSAAWNQKMKDLGLIYDTDRKAYT